MESPLDKTRSPVVIADVSAADRTGAGLLVSWLGFVAFAFWMFFSTPDVVTMVDVAQTQRDLEAWLRSQSTVASTASVFYFAKAPCVCTPSSNEFVDLQSRWRDRRVAFATVNQQTSALPNGADVAVFGADGHLAYAGPLHPGDFCTNGRGPADAVLDRLSHSPNTSPLVLETDCACGPTGSNT